MKTLLVSVLSLGMILLPIQSHALDSGIALSKELAASMKGNEYISGDFPGAVMMKINLWGAVNKSGIHYVPAKTDLVTLLSYAGGPTESATLGSVIIKRSIGGKQSVIDVDVDDILNSNNKSSPVLEANDIIIVDSTRPLFSNNTMQVLSVVATLISITLGSLIIRKGI